MTADLERLVQSAEGQGPSAEFAVRLRAQIVAETEGTTAGNSDRVETRRVDIAPAPPNDAPTQADDDGALVVDLAALQHDEHHRGELRYRASRRTQLLATAAAVAVVFIGMWALLSYFDDKPDEVDTVDIPPPTTGLSTESELGAPLTVGNTFFEAGTYQIDTLGTRFTFTVEETRGLLVNENDVVLITDFLSRNADDRTIVFRRTPLLPDPAAPTDVFDRRTGWPADDLLGWLEAASDNVAATGPMSTTIGGRDALFVELDFPCRGANCVANLPIEVPELPMFTPGSRYRLWVVDQGDEDPIVVMVAIDDEGETAWLDEADEILATVEFGEVEPNPVRRFPAGSIALDAFDGISLQLPEEVVVVEPFAGFARIFPPGVGVDLQQRVGLGWGGDIEFLTRPLDTGGIEVTTTERLVKLLEDKAVVLTDREAFDIGGVRVQTFDIDSGANPKVVLKLRPVDLVRSEFGWESPRLGHIWAIEHPERGLLVVSAEPELATGEALRPWAERLLRSLEFVES